MKSAFKKLFAGNTASLVRTFFLSVLFVSFLAAMLYVLITSPA